MCIVTYMYMYMYCMYMCICFINNYIRLVIVTKQQFTKIAITWHKKEISGIDKSVYVCCTTELVIDQSVCICRISQR